MPITYVSETMPADRVAAALTGAGFEVGRFQTVLRTVLDTFDGRLHAAGVRLEVRKGGDDATTLVVRNGDSAVAQARVDVVPSVARELPPGPSAPA